MNNKRIIGLLAALIIAFASLQINIYAEDTITVSFALNGDSIHNAGEHTQYESWIASVDIVCSSGATVYDVFSQTLDRYGYISVGAEDGYVSAIITPDSFRLAAFDNGPNSGWLYRVNGELPQVGLKDCVLSDGDSVVWYYADDFFEDWNGGSDSTATTTEITTESRTESTTIITTETGTEIGTEATTQNYAEENRSNINIINAKTPLNAKKKWAKDIGGGKAIATPIVVGEYIYTASGESLFKINKAGDIEKESKLEYGLGYQYFVTYGNGKIFVQENNGVIQAFDIDTLKSLWVSEVPNSGAYSQGVSPIYYDNGYIFAGTVTTYGDKSGTYYAMTTSDEDTTNQYEEKSFCWEFTPSVNGQYKGFYWAGGVIAGDLVIVGSEGGALFALDRYTGAVIDSCNALGDIRSSVVYYKGSAYFTTKSGYIYKVAVEDDGFGTVEYSSICKGAVESTSTPAIYNDRIYVGAMTSGNSKGAVAVIDCEGLENIYTYDTDGKVQSTGLIATGYEDSTLVYFTNYAKPGSVIKIADSGEKISGGIIYTATEDMGQYCINSVAGDTDGNLYYQNDSGYIIALEKNSVSDSGSSGSGSGGGSQTSSSITVDFSLRGDSVHGEGEHNKFEPWIENLAVKAKTGESVMDVFTYALYKEGYKFVGADRGYISSITTPSGVTLAEFTNGAKSGWLFSVNGASPEVGADEYKISEGDVILWYYTDDYTKDNSAISYGQDTDTNTESTTEIATYYIEGESVSTDSDMDMADTFRFRDVEAGSWAEKYIYSLFERGIVNGRGDGLFEPNEGITRAEAVTILYRLSKDEGEYTGQSYSDVEPQGWYYKQIEWASASGIIFGMGNGEFRPNDEITREDFACVVVRYCEAMGIEMRNINGGFVFVDDIEISQYAKEAVYRMFRWDLMTGVGDGYFEPDRGIERGEVCKVGDGLFEVKSGKNDGGRM